jgi:VWFA-related protein
MEVFKTMNKQIKRMTVSCTFLFLAAVLCLGAAVPGADADAGSGLQEDPITHEVSVDVVLVPIFITGPDDNPVFDLKKEDFKVKANGIPVQIAQFIQFNFEHQQEVVEKVTVGKKKKEIKQPSRAVFIIIDSVFTGHFGYRRAITTAIDIIKSSSPGDMIVVMENRAGAEPRHIAGPDESKESIINKIKKLRLPTGKWDKSLHQSRAWNPEADTVAFDMVHSSAIFEDLANLVKYREQLAYKNQVHQFGAFLSRFKYVLKTISRPKVVFLISQGIANAAFKNLSAPKSVQRPDVSANALLRTEKRVNEKHEDREMRMFVDLQKIVKAVNDGGSILYTINPGRARYDEDASGEMSMRYLAHESGGEYVAGSDSNEIIKKLKKITSAYYELAFLVTPDMERNIDLEITCKRKGIKVNTFKRTERRKPYYHMDKVEKKLFALNMVTGGSWSRMLGKVVRVKYRSLRNDNTGSGNATMIEVPLPDKMKDRKLDVFCIRIEPETQSVDIQLMSQAVKDRATLIIKKKSNTNEFFAIIEPAFTYCIYNKIL